MPHFFPRVVAAVAMAAVATAAFAQTAPAHYTPAQADHGLELFHQQCSLCHGDNLNDGEFGPALKGAYFKGQWGGKTAAQLFAMITTNMPPGKAGVMPAEDYADIMALLIKSNGMGEEGAALPADPKALEGLALGK